MDYHEFMVPFGGWVKARRKALDLTQNELSRRVGCSIYALRKIESGERRPSRQLAGLLAEALGIQEPNRQIFIRVARGELNTERLRSIIPCSLGESGIKSTAQPGETRGATLHDLPVPLTPILGRDTELEALERLFSDSQCRLLTLTGMGGIGKTRLAIEFATRYREMFPGGIFYVPLVSVNTAELMISAIAEAFAYAFSGPMNPEEQLIRYLSSQIKSTTLLVLDNLEHLIAPSSAVLDLVLRIIQRLPQLRILVTSRERLNVYGEWMYELHGLPVPPVDFTDNLELYSSVMLFNQCVRRIHPDYGIALDEQAILIRICRLLEGVPLAIELAAAWAEILSCEEIAREIELNMEFLATTMHDVPERHRSLRASFDHSWQLLSTVERMVLCRLAVFEGGFDRSAAEKVAGADLSLLASLSTKSLVWRTGSGRYDLHGVIKQFALAHLIYDDQEAIKAQDSHSEYYLAFYASRERALKSSLQQDTMRELILEMDNLRAAWAWAMQHKKFALLGAAVRCLGWYFEVSGLINEGIEHFDPLILILRRSLPDSDGQRALGQALTQQGMLFFRKGYFDQARKLMEESICLLRSTGDQVVLTDPLVYMGIILHLTGEIKQSRELMVEGLGYAQASGDEWFSAYAIYNLGYLDSLEGRYTYGYQQMKAGLAIWRRLGDPHSIAMGLNYLSPTLIRLRYCDEAYESLQESLKLCRQSGNRWGMGTAYRYLGLVELAHGNLEEARSLLYQSLDTFRDYIVGWDVARSFTYLGEAMLRSGDFFEARRTYREALRMAIEADSISLILDALAGMVHFDAWSGKCDQALEVGAFIMSQAAATYETKNRISQIISEMEACLDEQESSSIKQKIPDLTLESVAAIYLFEG
jgi:predicted ATPase/DNA-binding XRE family transcriptional regulator